MSIASEITRLQGVKSDILAAIANKGVTVPAGSALADCPILIGDIPSGGGITIPPGYKRLWGLRFAYKWDVIINDVSSMSGLSVADIEIECTVTSRGNFAPDSTQGLFNFNNINTRVAMGVNADGTRYRFAALASYNSGSNYGSWSEVTGVATLQQATFKVVLYRNTLKVYHQNDLVVDVSDVPYSTGRSIGYVSLFDVFNNNYESSYYLNEFIVRKKSDGTELMHCIPLYAANPTDPPLVNNNTNIFYDAVSGTFSTGGGIGIYQ